jgi:C1A family cysteine protease
MKKTILQKALMSGLVMTLLLLFVSVFSFAAELDEIKAAIHGKGAKWIAGETSVSKLPPEQRKLRVGLIKPEVTGKEKIISVEAPLAELPASLDWSSSNPISSNSCVTSVRDQGNCGSCWAFATAGALESYTLKQADCPVGDLDLAEQILVSCSGAGSCSGGYIDQASNFINNTGLPLEGCYPYTAANSKCRNACTNWQLNTDRIDSWSYVATTSPLVEDIKNALNTYGPLVTTMNVYTDFFYYSGEGVGVYSYTYGNYEGGHAILIVGYDDSGQYFIVKNSWGINWGKSGFFNIAYSQIGDPVEFGHYTIAYKKASACTYSISPTIQTFSSANAASGTVAVTTDASCSWNAVSNASWITITSGNSDTGTGSVGYNVSRNTKKPERTGTLTIAGIIFTIKQSGR